MLGWVWVHVVRWVWLHITSHTSHYLSPWSQPTGGDIPNMEPGLEDDASAITKKAQMMAAEIVEAVITSPKEAEPIRGGKKWECT